jgi:hypothetical protein
LFLFFVAMTKHNEEKKKVIDLSASITLQCAYNLLIRFLLSKFE